MLLANSDQFNLPRVQDRSHPSTKGFAIDHQRNKSAIVRSSPVQDFGVGRSSFPRWIAIDRLGMESIVLPY